MEVSRPALGPTQPPVLGTGSFPEVKRPRRGVVVSGNVHAEFQRPLRSEGCERIAHNCSGVHFKFASLLKSRGNVRLYCVMIN